MANVIDWEIQVEIDGEDVGFCFEELEHHAIGAVKIGNVL